MKIRLNEPTFGEAEIQAVVEVLRSTQVTQGKKVREFEKVFIVAMAKQGNISPRENAVMCNSGSSANLLAVAALCDPAIPKHLEPGDGVIVSALSWSTTVWPLVQYGLIPIIVDIDPMTLNIDPIEVKKAISSPGIVRWADPFGTHWQIPTNRVRAIMPVHVYGNPCDMWGLQDVTSWGDIVVIEDCCEALGAEFNGRPVGTFGDLATYSFYFSHHITTIEGGMCTTHRDDLVERLRILRAHGWVRDVDDERFRKANPDIDPRFLFVAAGYNLCPTEMAAAMGLVQLPKLSGFVKARRATADLLVQAFGRYENHLTYQHEEPNGHSSWFGFPVIVSDNAPFTAKEIREAFEEAGIETRPIICGNIARQPGLKCYPHTVVGDLPNATRVMKNGFSLPCHQAVDAAACDYIRDTLDNFMAAHV